MLISQRAVNTKCSDRNPADLAGGEFSCESLAAVGKALQNGIKGPLMPDTVFSGNITGIGGGGAGDNLSLTVNGYGSHVRRTTVEDQNNVLFHNRSWHTRHTSNCRTKMLMCFCPALE